jgi:hypothetical protein
MMVSQGIPSFGHDYLQTGYSYMLYISYLFNNNTLKCIKAKIFPFNQKLVLPSEVKNTSKIVIFGCAMEKKA